MALASPGLRTPRAKLLINGEAMPALFEVEVEINDFYRANTFGARLSMTGTGKPWSFWAGNAEMKVEVQFSLGGVFTTLFVGNVDLVTTNGVTNEVHLEGRDLTAELIDNRTTDKWLNFRSHRVVEVLAAKHGLKTVVTPSKNKVGSFFGAENASIKAGASEWDLISYLAQQEGRRLYVKADTLYWVDAKDVPQTPYALVWSGRPATPGTPTAKVHDLRFERNLTLAGDVKVIIQSYDPEGGATVTKTARADHTGTKGTRRKNVQTFVRTIPNLTPERAALRAQALLKEISQHEVRLFFTAPADNELDETSLIKVSGTGTEYDQDFFPDVITRRWSFDEGYKMDVRAKNHLPTNEVVV